jgi:signal transduction histidine kinase
MAKFIRKNTQKDPVTDNGRMIYFSKTPIQNINPKIQQENQDKQILIVDSKDKKEDRITTINRIIEEEKTELNTIHSLIKQQSKSLNRAKKYLIEKQLLIQSELDRKAFRFSNNEKFAVMGELSSRMAHDIRNPLTVIKMQVDLFKLRYSKQEDKIMLDSLSRMERAVNGITNQVEDVLNFLRDTPLQFENHNVLQILNESLQVIHVPDNVTIELPENDYVFLCDRYKIQRIFTNIIQNSIQAMEKGGTITIQIFEQNNNICIEIKDTGPGIPDDVLPKIFEPLFTTKRAGTGLGLTICKKIVEDHNGSISVKNNPTTFTTLLPKNPQQD